MSEKKPIDKQLLIWKIASIAITVLFVPIIFFNSFLIISTVAAKDKVPMMFGYGTVFVMSDSMKGEFETNDAILIKKVDDINSLQIGDIICYREDGGFVTHRIDGIAEKNGEKVFVTKGDANNSVDRESVSADQIQGIYVRKMTGLYNFIDFMQSPLGVMLLVIAPCLVYARYEVYTWQKKKEKELAEANAALGAATSELEETKRKLAELTERGVAPAAEESEDADNGEVTVAEEIAVVTENEDGANTEEAVDAGAFVLSGSLSEIKLRRSFMARYIQADESIQRYYNTIKNLLLSYGKVKERISWKSESFKSGRTHVAKIDIKGKKLYLYLALNPADFADSKYFFTDLSAKDSNLPMLVKIKSDRAEKHAVELIGILAEKLGLVKVDRDDENYSMPYETDEALIARGLIKVVAGEMPVIAPAMEAPAEEIGATDLTDANENENTDNTDEFVLAGSLSEIRLRRSFMARYIQADESLQTYYTNIKNLLLSFKRVKARTSWKAESFKQGRTHVAKIDIKGKKLYLYLALDPAEFADSKYFITDLSAKNTSLPMLIKIKSNRAEKHATELIEILAEKLGLAKTDIESEDYRLPYETDEQLIAKGLIKVIGAPPQADAPETIEETDTVEVAEIVDESNDGEVAEQPDSIESADDTVAVDEVGENADTSDDTESADTPDTAEVEDAPADTEDADGSDQPETADEVGESTDNTGRRVVTLTADMLSPSVKRKPKPKAPRIIFLDDEAPEGTYKMPLTKAKYLSLSRTQKKAALTDYLKKSGKR